MGEIIAGILLIVISIVLLYSMYLDKDYDFLLACGVGLVITIFTAPTPYLITAHFYVGMSVAWLLKRWLNISHPSQKSIL